MLQTKLDDLGFNGTINFGYGTNDGLNKPEAIKNAVNKRVALLTLAYNNVNVPNIYLPPKMPTTWPVVGRRDKHTCGSGFYLCNNEYEYNKTRSFDRPPTYYLQYITDAREFRVHIVGGKSIKIIEKLGTPVIIDNKLNDDNVRWRYPHNFDHKQQLRSIAAKAVEALGLDFGAVDILYTDKPYVLEVNTAPSLKSIHNDTVNKYAQAFMAFSEHKQLYFPNNLLRWYRHYL